MSENEAVIPNKGHGYWIGRIVLFLILILIISAIVSSILVGIVMALFKFSIEDIQNPKYSLLIIQPITVLFLIAFIRLYTFFVHPVKPDYLSLKVTIKEVKEFSKGFGMGIIIFLLFLIPALIFGSGRLVFNNDLSWITLVQVIVVLYIMAFFEEYLYRGYFFNVFLNNTNPVIAVILSSVLFSITHLLNPNISVVGSINIFLFGIFLCLMFMVHKNLYILTGIHFIWNFLSVITGMNVSGLTLKNLPFTSSFKSTQTLITGGTFGPEGSLITIGILVLLCAGYLFILQKGEKSLSSITIEEYDIPEPDLDKEEEI